ncbi:unnamed protein product [Symbiodinium natans]|uniref:Uncharacterized protein n=1 Tax=Symbiodinium natans TaxID=878477 RepID=A0A812Q8Z4_9DINO|nr:unnamed protein product [Symbiodinium natans]
MLEQLQSALLDGLFQLLGVKKHEVKDAPRNTKQAIAASAALLLLFTCLLLAVMTGVMLHAFRSVAVNPSGVLTLPEDEAMVAGLGEAVDLCGLADYPKLPAQDLRRIEDVAFSLEGAFHFYRVASIHQTKGGGVRIEAEDGTRLLVQDGTVSFERRWFSKDAFTQDESVGLGGPAATLRIVQPDSRSG